jgi:hypothetical protein
MALLAYSLFSGILLGGSRYRLMVGFARHVGRLALWPLCVSYVRSFASCVYVQMSLVPLSIELCIFAIRIYEKGLIMSRRLMADCFLSISMWSGVFTCCFMIPALQLRTCTLLRAHAPACCTHSLS